MVKINYVESNGATHRVEVDVGSSLMEGATKNNVPGIDADCGGACACGTCHCFIDASWTGAIGSVSEMEASMLEFVDDANSSSRLSCQIRVTEALDGLTVRLPASQH